MGSEFRRVLLEAIREDETMSRREKRRMTIVVFLRPQVVSQLEQAVVALAIEESVLPDNQLLENVDWDTLLAFIKELLPLILEIIMTIIALG